MPDVQRGVSTRRGKALKPGTGGWDDPGGHSDSQGGLCCFMMGLPNPDLKTQILEFSGSGMWPGLALDTLSFHSISVENRMVRGETRIPPVTTNQIYPPSPWQSLPTAPELWPLGIQNLTQQH